MGTWTKCIRKHSNKFYSNVTDTLKERHDRNKENGFIYGDIMVSVLICILVMPFTIYMYIQCSESIHKAYMLDRVGQDVVSYLERGKGEFHKNGTIKSLTNQSLTRLSINDSFSYIGVLEPIIVNGIPTMKYTVKAYYDGRYIYEASTYVWERTEK